MKSKRHSGISMSRPVLAGPDDCLITRGQAAKLLSVNDRTVDRLTRRGLFKSYYLGSMIRFLKSEVLAAWESPQVK